MGIRFRINKTLTDTDIIKFYVLKQQFNPTSDIIGVVSKNFKQILKFVKRKYNPKDYTILQNKEAKSIVVVKEDFIEKYIVLETLDDVSNSIYKFKRYL